MFYFSESRFLRSKVLILVILFGLGAGGFFVYKNFFAPEVEEKAPAVEEKLEEEAVEILKDTKFEWGFTDAGGASNLPDGIRCEMPVQGKKPVWAVAEIATETHFCKNLPNPKSIDPTIIFESEGGHKKFSSYKDGRIRLQLDSNAEEKQGCVITNPMVAVTSWIDYGVRQAMLVDFADFEKLNFNADVKLNKFKLKIPDQDCTEHGAIIEKYGEFMIIFLLRRKGGTDAPKDLFWLLLVTCSKHWWPGAWPVDKACTSNSAEYIMTDQFGIPMYHLAMDVGLPILERAPQQQTPKQPILKPGKWVNYNLDVKKLAQDAFRYYNTQYDPDLDLGDYNLAHVSFDWEIIGAFDTDIEIRSLSLRGKKVGD